MKNEGGFTLVELMVVVSITVLLLAWGIPSYSSWKKKHDIENQMVQLYSDLQFGRMTSYGNKVVSGVLWSNSFATYKIMSDKANTGTIDTGATQVPGTGTVTPKYAVTPPPNNQVSVSFDGRGFLYTTAADPLTSITFYVSSNSGAAIDCVAVSSTRIILGKMNAGVCKPK